jgi:hypothetical protein
MYKYFNYENHSQYYSENNYLSITYFIKSIFSESYRFYRRNFGPFRFFQVYLRN